MIQDIYLNSNADMYYILSLLYEWDEEDFIGAQSTFHMIESYLLHFTLNTTPPPGRVSSPNRAAAVAIASSGE